MKVRHVLSVLALAFAAYLALRGLLPSEPIERPALLAVGVGLLLGATVLALYVPGRMPSATAGRGERMPTWTAALVLGVSAVLPWIVAASAESVDRQDPHITWFIGATGVLMTIVMVRRRALWAWAGIALHLVIAALLLGLLDALALGVIGSMLWVGVAQLLQYFTDRSYDDTVRLAELQQASAAWQASQLVRKRERRERVRFALETAGPVLTAVIASGGSLAPAQRAEARIAEGALRDELRAPALLDEEVRAVIAELRGRGITVTLLDEGGLDGLDAAALAAVRGEVARTLRSARAARLIVRSAPHPAVAVTIVGRSGLSDDDSVELWHEVAHRHEV
jgi:hypothetical protein